jgi:hypothetical protein
MRGSRSAAAVQVIFRALRRRDVVDPIGNDVRALAGIGTTGPASAGRNGGDGLPRESGGVIARIIAPTTVTLGFAANRLQRARRPSAWQAGP